MIAQEPVAGDLDDAIAQAQLFRHALELQMHGPIYGVGAEIYYDWAVTIKQSLQLLAGAEFLQGEPAHARISPLESVVVAVAIIQPHWFDHGITSVVRRWLQRAPCQRELDLSEQSI